MGIYFSTSELTFVASSGPVGSHAIRVSHSKFREMLTARECGYVVAAGPDGQPVAEMPPPPPIAEIQAAAWERIKAERDRRTMTGGYQANGYWFHSDQLSRDQQLKLMLAGENVPRVGWKTMTGEFVQMTPELAEAIVLASGDSDIAIFAAAEAHRAAMLASPDPAAYDYSQGWPLTYDEWAAQQEA